MADIINEIVEVTISATSQTIVETSFNSLLIVGNTKDDVEDVISYSSLATLLADNYAEDSNEYLIASEIFAQSPRINKILVAQVLDGETFLTCYNRVSASHNSEFYGVVITSDVEANILAIANVVEGQKKIFGVSALDPNIKNGIGNNLLVELEGKKRTFMFYNETALAPAAALMGKMFTFDAGSATWIYKNFSSVPAEMFTDTQRTYLETNNCFYYSNMGNVGVTLMNGKTIGGSYLDVTHGIDFFESFMQTNIANLLISAPKIPYTNAGLLLIESAIDKSLKIAVNRGILSDYTIEMPVYTEISTQDKSNRILRNCKFFGTLAGAIHKITIAGTVTV